MRLRILFAAVLGIAAVAVVPLHGAAGSLLMTPAAELAVNMASGARDETPASQARGEMPASQARDETPSAAPSMAPADKEEPAEKGRPKPKPSPSPAAAPPPVNCALRVPENPLTARGLATPWELSQAGDAPCKEADPNASAFVQGAVIDPATGQVSVYNPLVIDRGSRAAIEPTRPALPAGAVVGLWVGFNGNNISLTGPGAGSCVTGVGDSAFGQNAFCNATAFFAAANKAIAAGKLTPPALAMAKDGKPCPTSRDFSIVDQDQSDNTTTVYLATANGRMAQDTPQNAAKLMNSTPAKNGSDEGLLDRAVDTALGCTPWTVPDLADTTHKQQSTAWPLNELVAAMHQAPPTATIPTMDPFVLVDGHTNLRKLNAYRAGVDQPQVTALSQASTTTYCRNLLDTGLPRIAADRQFTTGVASPFPNLADNLFDFLALRFNQTFSNADGFLFCQRALHLANPVTLQMTNDVVTGAQIDLHPARA